MDTLNTATFDVLKCDFAEIEVRVVAHLGLPWFTGADIRHVLEHAGQGDFYRGLADDEMMDAPADLVRALNALRVSRHHGGNLKRAKLVSESGLYKLVMRSEKPVARPLQEWVTREVLPAIRRTGGYRLAGVAPEAVEEGTVAEMPDVGGIMAQLREMRAELAASQAAFEARVADDVAKILAALSAGPSPDDLLPKYRASDALGLAFAPKDMEPLEAGGLLLAYSDQHGLPVKKKKGTYAGKPRTTRFYTMAAIKGVFCPR